jgi:hypothetical protein
MEEKETPTSNESTSVSRESLYQEVWSEPMTSIALRYKVSSSFLARVCTRLNVPRPDRGYWAKFAVGKRTKRPPLPNADPGDELEWVRNGQARRAPRERPKPPQGKKTKLRRRIELPSRHPLLDGAREHFDAGRESYNGFLKPSKRLLVDIIVSKKIISRALDVLNELFLLLEGRGHHVMFSPRDQVLWRHAIDEREKGGRDRHYSDLWRPARATVVFVGTVAIGLTIFEMSEEVEVRYLDGEYVRVTDLTPQQLKKAEKSDSWTTTHDLPSGRLCVQAYSPYCRAERKRQWRERKAGDFPGKLSAIVKDLNNEAATIAKLVEEGERKAEIERQRWEAQKLEWDREEAERRRIKAEKDSREELSNIIHAWAEAKRIEEFFADAERRAADLCDDEKRIVLERLKLARKMVGSIDALQQFGTWKAPSER